MKVFNKIIELHESWILWKTRNRWIASLKIITVAIDTEDLLFPIALV